MLMRPAFTYLVESAFDEVCKHEIGQDGTCLSYDVAHTSAILALYLEGSGSNLG